MKRQAVHVLPIFLLAAVLGVLLHGLYGWLPSPLTAVIAPVRESLWEHLKILYVPLLLSALWLAKGDMGALTARLAALEAVCALMLGIGYLYHVVFRADGAAFDIGLYFVLMALGFLLPRLSWPLGEGRTAPAAVLGLAVLLGAFMVYFTFYPPDGVLFADLSGGVRTWLTIPV